MKHWLGRTPRTVGDWLGLALGTALIFGGVAQLPALAAALGPIIRSRKCRNFSPQRKIAPLFC